MKLAVIDCGTNTFNLLIVQVNAKNQYSKLYHTRVAVKLGEGTINGGYIDQKPFERGMDALRGFSEKIKEEKVEKTLAFATSAIRDGKNGAEFVKAANEKFGIDINVIDGEREADLVYLAVNEAVQLGKDTSLIMDIGGGSVEFLLANKEKVFWKRSFKIGAARLLAMFKPSDPITDKEISAINDFLSEQLQPLLEASKVHRPEELVGSSGAFESFVEVIHTEFGGEAFSNEKIAYTIDLKDYYRVSALIVPSTMAERKQIRGLVPMRYDMIVICCLMVNYILEALHLKTMRMSAWSLKEGAMVDFVKQYQ